eukprot:c25301_g2_i1 orf=320-499(-)
MGVFVMGCDWQLALTELKSSHTAGLRVKGTVITHCIFIDHVGTIRKLYESARSNCWTCM